MKKENCSRYAGMTDYYYKQWQIAEAKGDQHYAYICKHKYHELMMNDVVIPYHQFIFKLKEYPALNLN